MTAPWRRGPLRPAGDVFDLTVEAVVAAGLAVADAATAMLVASPNDDWPAPAERPDRPAFHSLPQARIKSSRPP